MGSTRRYRADGRRRAGHGAVTQPAADPQACFDSRRLSAGAGFWFDTDSATDAVGGGVQSSRFEVQGSMFNGPSKQSQWPGAQTFRGSAPAGKRRLDRIRALRWLVGSARGIRRSSLFQSVKNPARIVARIHQERANACYDWKRRPRIAATSVRTGPSAVISLPIRLQP